MTYSTGTITPPTDPPADFYAVLAAALTSAGFTLVDTVVISTRTHKVWKSPAGSNSLGQDWYLDVVYTTTGTGTFHLFPMEYFDPATDLAYRMTIGALASTAAPESTYYSRYGATGYSLENSNWGNTAANSTALSVSTSTSTFGYWISATPNRVIILTTGAASNVFYTGLYDLVEPHASHVGAAAFPLVMAKLSGTGIAFNGNSAASVTAALTRIPKRTAALPANTNYGWSAIGNLQPLFTPGSGAPESMGFLPALTSTEIMGGNYATPIVVLAGMALDSTSPNAMHTGLLGTLKDVAVCQASSAVTRGDTATVGGASHVLTTVSSNTTVMFKAA